MGDQVDKGYSGRQWAGDKFERGRNVKDIAKDVRRDIKQLVAAGDLPAIKVSVKISRGSMTQAIDVRVTEAPFEILNRDRLIADIERPNEYDPRIKTYTLRAEALLKVLEGVLNAYNRDDSASEVDYFDCHFYGRVEFDYEVKRAERDQFKAHYENAKSELAGLGSGPLP